MAMAGISTCKRLSRWFLRVASVENHCSKVGIGDGKGEEKACLSEGMKSTKCSDVLDRPGEIGDKEGSKVKPTLHLRLQGLKKNY